MANSNDGYTPRMRNPFRGPTDEEKEFLKEAEGKMLDVEKGILDRIDGKVFKTYQDYEDGVGDAFEDFDKEFHDELCKTLAKFPGMLMGMWRGLRNHLRESDRFEIEGLEQL